MGSMCSRRAGFALGLASEWTYGPRSDGGRGCVAGCSSTAWQRSAPAPFRSTTACGCPRCSTTTRWRSSSAAGRCQALTASELCARLGDHPDVLRARSGAVDQRHASVTVALDWSIAQLEPGTRTLLERAVIISGGFDLEAAEGIMAFGDVAHGEVLDHLEDLVAHNLVHRDHRRVASGSWSRSGRRSPSAEPPPTNSPVVTRRTTCR